MTRPCARTAALVATAAALLVAGGCSTDNKDVQVRATNSDGVAAVYAATHERGVGSDSRLIADVSTYVQVNKRIGFNWRSGTTDATKTAIVNRLCASPGIESIKNDSGNSLCAPR